MVLRYSRLVSRPTRSGWWVGHEDMYVALTDVGLDHNLKTIYRYGTWVETLQIETMHAPQWLSPTSLKIRNYSTYPVRTGA